MAPALVVGLVLVYALLGEWLRGGFGLPGNGAAPSKGEGLRIASWNLRNFPEPTQDLERLRARLQGLGADLLALQEIHDPLALKDLLPAGWALHFSEHGGRGHQRLGIAFDPGKLELVEPAREHAELAMGGRVRPGLSAYLRARGGGPDFHVLVVHLKATPAGYALRQRQWSSLAAIAGDLLRRDPDLIILGDFNTTGTRGAGPEAELEALGAVLGPLGLRRLAPDAPCSAYWDGSRRDAWHEPSLLDLVWVAALDESLSAATGVRALHHCARHHCQPFRSTPAHPELDYVDLSDHCPVLLDLNPGDDDDP